MAISAGIEIEGLAAFRRDLKKIDEQLTKELREELLVIGRDVAAGASAKVPVRTGRAKASIRAGVSGNTAYVAGGKQSVPYYAWLDFGSREPNRGQARSVGPWRKSGEGPKGGRFIFPTVAASKPDIERRSKEAFDKAAEKALQKNYP